MTKSFFKHFLLTTFLAFFIMLIQTALARYLEWGFARVDGVSSLVVWCSLAMPLPIGLFLIAAISFTAEAFSSVTTGLYTLSFILSYFFIRYTLSNIMIQYFIQKMLFVAFTALLTTTMLLALEGLADMIWPWAVIQAIFSALVSPCFFYLFHKISKKLTLQDNV